MRRREAGSSTHSGHKNPGERTFCSISSAQGTEASSLRSSPVGKMPKNWGGRLMGQLHWLCARGGCGGACVCVCVLPGHVRGGEERGQHRQQGC